MKHVKLLVCFMCLLSLSGCARHQTGFTVSSGINPQMRLCDLLNGGDLILRGKVTEMSDQYFAYERGESSENGNYQTTVYTIQVLEVYKGEWNGDVISGKVYNGFGVPPEYFDQYLETGSYSLSNGDRVVGITSPEYIDTDREYIFCIRKLSEESPAFNDTTGYLLGSSFRWDDDGHYVCRWPDGQSAFVTRDSILDDIKKAEKEK